MARIIKKLAIQKARIALPLFVGSQFVILESLAIFRKSAKPPAKIAPR